MFVTTWSALTSEVGLKAEICTLAFKYTDYSEPIPQPISQPQSGVTAKPRESEPARGRAQPLNTDGIHRLICGYGNLYGVIFTF